jgi:hypothetical protein
LRAKLVDRKIALDAIALFTVRIEYQDAWCPQCVEAMEVSGMFFDVCFQRDEVFVDE